MLWLALYKEMFLAWLTDAVCTKINDPTRYSTKENIAESCGIY